MFSRKTSGFAIGLAAGAMILTGCTTGQGGGDGGTDDDDISIGVIELDRSQLFSTQQHPAIEEALTAKGWTVNFIDSAGNPASAISGMQNLIQSGVDAIVVQTYSADQLTAGLAAAEEAGVPVFSTGGGPVAEGMAGAIEYIGAKPINDALIESIQDEESVKLLKLGFTPGAPCRAREDDLDEQLSELDNVEVTEGELSFPGADQVSQNAATGFFQANPENDTDKFVLWVCTSDALGGLLAAQAQADRGPYDIWTWDLSEPSIAALEEGKVSGVLYLPADATSEQLADLIEDRLEAGDDWEPTTIEADAVVVTPENVDEYSDAN